MSAEITRLLIARTESAREILDAEPGKLSSFESSIRDLVGALECVAALAIPAEPVETIELRGETVRIERAQLDPEVRAFRKIAAFVGAAGYEGGVDASELMSTIAGMVAAVPGYPDPLSADSEAHYRAAAFDRLTRRERRLLGIRGER